MDANKRKYGELVGGSVQFVIPVFQRDYNWAEEQCEQLWDDIERTGERMEPIIFLARSYTSRRWVAVPHSPDGCSSTASSG